MRSPAREPTGPTRRRLRIAAILGTRGGSGLAADEPYGAGRARWLEPDERAEGSRARRVAVEPARIARARGEIRNPTLSRGGFPACGVRLGSRRARPAGDSHRACLGSARASHLPRQARALGDDERLAPVDDARVAGLAVPVENGLPVPVVELVPNQQDALRGRFLRVGAGSNPGSCSRPAARTRGRAAPTSRSRRGPSIRPAAA